MPKTVTEIKGLIQPIFNRSNVHLVDLQLRGQPNSQVLSVYVDTDTGITLEQIADISREIEGILDLENIIPGRYRLDVSSPGVDRPITDKWQFEKNVGRDLNVWYTENDKKLEKSGTLQRVETDGLILDSRNGEFSIPFSRILKAIVTIKL